MSTFDDREAAFESEFAHNAELKFKVESRAAKLVGLWAAEKKGLTDEEAETFARSVVTADLEEAGREDVFRKLRSELDASVSDEDIREQMAATLSEAMAQFRSEG